jgi:hypothetical protein
LLEKRISEKGEHHHHTNERKRERIKLGESLIEGEIQC